MRSLRFFILLITAVVVILSVNVAFTAPIYHTDFSTNPNWTTDQPSNFYWDSASQSYFMRAENNWPGYSPSRYFYEQLTWDFGSFQMSWDVNISRVDWSASIDVGLYDSYLEGPFTYDSGQGITVDYSNVDRGRSLSIYVCGVGGCTATSTAVGGAYSTNVWYTNTLTYDESSNLVNLDIINRATLAPVWSTNLSVNGGFSTSLDYLGGSNSAKSHYGGYTGVNQWAIAEGNIDNMNMAAVPEPTTILLLGSGLLGLGAFRRKFKK